MHFVHKSVTFFFQEAATLTNITGGKKRPVSKVQDATGPVAKSTSEEHKLKKEQISEFGQSKTKILKTKSVTKNICQ